MTKLIILLVRMKLGLKKGQQFKFVGQKTNARYFFTDTNIIKIDYGLPSFSNVSLNWLLNDECKIIKMDENGE